MPPFFDPDDVPDDVREEAAEQRRRAKSRCPACNGRGGMHSQGCPEDDPPWAKPEEKKDE